jgi:S1-C subfamily serine protease
VTRGIAASPAARAELRIGEVIAGLGDATVTDAGDLATVVDSTPPGERLIVTYLRAGQNGTGSARSCPASLTARASPGDTHQTPPPGLRAASDPSDSGSRC